MRKADLPTPAQARLIASMWSGCRREVNIGGYVSPTEATAVRRGWLVSTGRFGNYPNGAGYTVHVLSDTAEDALLSFLINSRHSRKAA